MVWYPLTWSVSRISFRFLGLSSTTRMGSFAMTHPDREREGRTRSHLTLDPDPPPMELDKLPTKRQPQPSTLHLLLRRPHLTELLEDRVLILQRGMAIWLRMPPCRATDPENSTASWRSGTWTTAQSRTARPTGRSRSAARG